MANITTANEGRSTQQPTMANITTTNEGRSTQQPKHTARVSTTSKCIPAFKDTDLLGSIDWNVMDGNSEESEAASLGLALLNVVELEQDELAYLTESSGNEANTNEDKDKVNKHRKRAREDEDRKKPGVSPDLQDKVSSGIGELIPVDESPRVSRRHKRFRHESLPKRPMSAFGTFYHQERQKIVESMESSLSEDDIQKQVGKLWRHLQADDQQKYEKLASQDKKRYQQEMLAYTSGEALSSKSDTTNDQEEEDEEYVSSDLPPPPPGVLIIPSNGGPTTPVEGKPVEETLTNQVTPSGSWDYPSPVPSKHLRQTSPSLPRPDFRQARVVTDQGHASPVRRTAPMPYPPYHHQYLHYPVSPPRPYSPHFGRPARLVFAAAAQPRQSPSYCIPPDMELALPSRSGGEQRYKVTYQCYKMKAEDVPSFLESLATSHPSAQQYQQYQYGPPRCW